MRVRRDVYRLGRVMGDVEAASQGPSALGRRVVRRAVYRHVGRATRSALRAFGMSR